MEPNVIVTIPTADILDIVRKKVNNVATKTYQSSGNTSVDYDRISIASEELPFLESKLLASTVANLASLFSHCRYYMGHSIKTLGTAPNTYDAVVVELLMPDNALGFHNQYAFTLKDYIAQDIINQWYEMAMATQYKEGISDLENKRAEFMRLLTMRTPIIRQSESTDSDIIIEEQ